MGEKEEEEGNIVEAQKVETENEEELKEEKTLVNEIMDISIVKETEATIKTQVEKKKRVYVPACPPAPTFANANYCESCNIEVGGIFHAERHHCRNCGGTFCIACSRHNIRIPYEEYRALGKLRSCEACFSRIVDFFAQTKTHAVTWTGLPPLEEDTFCSTFELSLEEVC